MSVNKISPLVWFSPFRSPVKQLLTLISVIDKAFENNDSVDCIYEDFCKAFDSVPHAKLSQKLMDFGFTGE